MGEKRSIESSDFCFVWKDRQRDADRYERIETFVLLLPCRFVCSFVWCVESTKDFHLLNQPIDIDMGDVAK